MSTARCDFRLDGGQDCRVEPLLLDPKLKRPLGQAEESAVSSEVGFAMQWIGLGGSAEQHARGAYGNAGCVGDGDLERV